MENYIGVVIAVVLILFSIKNFRKNDREWKDWAYLELGAAIALLMFIIIRVSKHSP